MPGSALPDVPSGAALTVQELVIAFPGAGPVLSVVTLALPPGSASAVEGPSGAGKTSLLHVLAGIERPSAGQVRWDSDDIWAMSGPARDRWRRHRLGLVFQDMHLLPGLSALDNVLLPVSFDHARVRPALRACARALLDSMGIADPARRAAVLSRGERQRVALARALLRKPIVLLADEPTASLDAAAAHAVGTLLLDAAAAEGTTLLVATHDPALLARLPCRLRLHAGRLESA